MIHITTRDLPDEMEGASVEAEGDNEVTEKFYDDMNPTRIPEFFAQIGRIEGYMEILNDHWWDGQITLTVEKALHVFEGNICLYNETADTIREALTNIEELAHSLSTSFEARSYRVVFQRKNKMVFEAP